MITDIERILGSDGIGRIKIKGKKLLRVRYADDLVLAEDKKEMRWLLKRLESYVKKEICDKWRK